MTHLIIIGVCFLIAICIDWWGGNFPPKIGKKNKINQKGGRHAKRSSF